MKTKIKFIIPLFNPSKINFDQFKKLMDFGFNISFFLNSAINEKILLELKLISKNKKCDLIGNHTNDGISRVINYSLKKYKVSHDFLIFLDQDTLVDAEKFTLFVKEFRTILDSNFVVYAHNNTKPNFFITNSGSIFNLKKLDFFIDEAFFVELVDYWICFRIKQAGNDIIQIKTDFIDHKSQQDNIYSFFGKKIKKYSNKRSLEIFKNSFLLIFKIIKSRNISLKIKYTFVKNIFKEVLLTIFQFFLR